MRIVCKVVTFWSASCVADFSEARVFVTFFSVTYLLILALFVARIFLVNTKMLIFIDTFSSIKVCVGSISSFHSLIHTSSFSLLSYPYYQSTPHARSKVLNLFLFLNRDHLFSHLISQTYEDLERKAEQVFHREEILVVDQVFH